MRIVKVVLLAVAIFGAAGATQSAYAVDTMGIGAQPCSVFIKALGGPQEKEFMAWILGYRSGLAVERNKNMLGSQSSAAVRVRAIALCRPDADAYLDDVLDDF